MRRAHRRDRYCNRSTKIIIRDGVIGIQGWNGKVGNVLPVAGVIPIHIIFGDRRRAIIGYLEKELGRRLLRNIQAHQNKTHQPTGFLRRDIRPIPHARPGNGPALDHIGKAGIHR